MILSLFQPLLSATTTTPRSLYTFWGPSNAIYQLVLFLRNASSTKVVVYEARCWHSQKPVPRWEQGCDDLFNGCFDFESCRSGQY